MNNIRCRLRRLMGVDPTFFHLLSRVIWLHAMWLFLIQHSFEAAMMITGCDCRARIPPDARWITHPILFRAVHTLWRPLAVMLWHWVHIYCHDKWTVGNNCISKLFAAFLNNWIHAFQFGPGRVAIFVKSTNWNTITPASIWTPAQKQQHHTTRCWQI